jgi:acyl carrier protein
LPQQRANESEIISMTYDEVRKFVETFLMHRLSNQGRDTSIVLAEECDLLLSGLIDSLGVLELLTALGNQCGKDIDFETLDPEEMTIVGPLCRFVSAQSTTSYQKIVSNDNCRL